MKKLLIVAATTYELASVLKWLEESGQKQGFNRYLIGNSEIQILITGVGMVSTMFALCRYPKMNEIDQLIQLGVAGSYDKTIPLGSSVEVIEDRNADLGVETKNGSFESVFDLELKNKDQFPLSDGWVRSEHSFKSPFQKVKGISVNKVTGTNHSADKMKERHPGTITESMEGFAFLYYCRMLHIEGIQIRCISNYVEDRDRDKWELERAIEGIKTAFISLLNI